MFILHCKQSCIHNFSEIGCSIYIISYDFNKRLDVYYLTVLSDDTVKMVILHCKQRKCIMKFDHKLSPGNPYKKAKKKHCNN